MTKIRPKNKHIPNILKGRIYTEYRGSSTKHRPKIVHSNGVKQFL